MVSCKRGTHFLKKAQPGLEVNRILIFDILKKHKKTQPGLEVNRTLNFQSKQKNKKHATGLGGEPNVFLFEKGTTGLGGEPILIFEISNKCATGLGGEPNFDF